MICWIEIHCFWATQLSQLGELYIWFMNWGETKDKRYHNPMDVSDCVHTAFVQAEHINCVNWKALILVLGSRTIRVNAAPSFFIIKLITVAVWCATYFIKQRLNLYTQRVNLCPVCTLNWDDQTFKKKKKSLPIVVFFPVRWDFQSFLGETKLCSLTRLFQQLSTVYSTL